jgi:hypothetical protein
MMPVGEKNLDQAQLDLETSKAWGDDGRVKSAQASREEDCQRWKKKRVVFD